MNMKFYPYHFIPAISFRLPAAIIILLILCTGILSAQTLYSYQSGNWNSQSTWTTDPSGTLFINPASLTPDGTTDVCILNGRTVTLTDNSLICSGLLLREGAYLSLGQTTDHNFGVVEGKGTIQIEVSASSFDPATDFSAFVLPEGGTFEFQNKSSFPFPSGLSEYNNLIINAENKNIVVTLLEDLSINGNLIIQKGTLRINDDVSSTPLSLLINGNLKVEKDGCIRTGKGDAEGGHTTIIKGDLINHGNVWFSNLTSPLYQTYPDNGYVHTLFTSETHDQSVQCLDTIRFYRIGVQKGLDKTYVLNIDATDSSYFKLLGNNYQTPDYYDETDNGNALGLESGTCRLGNNIVIPCLSTGYYYIKKGACLWLDGSRILFRDASYTPPPGPGVNNCGLYIYGTLKLTKNARLTLNNFSFRGIVLRGAASVELYDNSKISASMIRTSADGSVNRGVFAMYGNSTVDLTGNTYESRFATFDLGFPDNVFIMEGGNLIIRKPTTPAGVGKNFSLHIACEKRNINVTGGLINLMLPSDIYFNSTAPFWNLTITGAVNGNTAIIRRFEANESPALDPQPLIIKNNLVLSDFAQLESGNTSGSPAVVDVFIGRNFVIDENASYISGANNTVFNGDGGQEFLNKGQIINGLYNMKLSGTSNLNLSNDLNIRNDLDIGEKCTLSDLGNSIEVSGNISNSGKHNSQTNGQIILAGTTRQILGGTGTGIFGNLTLINLSGALLASNQTIEGKLRLPVDALFFIENYTLNITASGKIYSSLTGNETSFSANRMIVTAGNESDGGILKEYGNGESSFCYPFGTEGKFTPALIHLNEVPLSYGSINIRPVNRKFAFASSDNALKFYWKTRSTGFNGLGDQGIRLTFHYNNADVVPAEGDVQYTAGVYRNGQWIFQSEDLSTVDQINDTIKFPSSVNEGISFIDGYYTAGNAASFGSQIIYYSRTNGSWDDNDTWSNDSVGGNPATSIPGPYNPVVIGNGISKNHTITIHTNGIVAGNLQLSKNSVLDVQTTTGHNFGTIIDPGNKGKGTLRISSSTANAEFPGGDFGSFLDSLGGTVEYYLSDLSSITGFTIPGSSFSGMPLKNYRNLIITTSENRKIILPENDILVYNNMICNGSNTTNSITGLSNGPVPQLLTIRGNLIINSGCLVFTNRDNSTPQHIVIDSNLVINVSAALTVESNGVKTPNTLTVSGNILNDGILNLYPGAGPYCTLVFKGERNAEFTGTGSLTRLNTITMDKGFSRTPVMDIKVNGMGFTLNNNSENTLELIHGTLRFSNTANVIASYGEFTIPGSACLSINGANLTLCRNEDNAADLYLNGQLEVLKGSTTIGNTVNASNNDIEYAAAGKPEITLAGGTLNVLGQIRRSTIIENGSLNYRQSGGDVYIFGRELQQERAIFEILNDGSYFEMKGGTITLISSFNNPSNIDLYLKPTANRITGGSLRLGNAISAPSDFNIAIMSPVWNLVVDGNTTSKTANLRISPLTILNDLIIGQPGGVSASLVTNGFTVNIGHNLNNYNTNTDESLTAGGFQSTVSEQKTVFTGSSDQLITGVSGNITNFANLIISNTDSSVIDSLADFTQIRVNGNLILEKGVLSNGNNDIVIKGNIENNAIHRSLDNSYGLVLTGDQKQFISGNGSGVFGNIAFDNSFGVDMLNNSTIEGRLSLINGIFYIDDMLLTLGAHAAIGGGTDALKMICTNGVLSDLGVKKIFEQGSSSFIFPMGVSGKYTPTSFTILSNPGSGSITVKPVDQRHPATSSGTEVLNYYWYVKSSGFNAGITLSHTYKYTDTDAPADESASLPARYSNNQWSHPVEATLDATNNSLLFSNITYIDGEYTCGKPDVFLNLPTYYSRQATAGTPAGAPWELATSWTLDNDGDGSPVSDPPSGNPIVIMPAHKIYTQTAGNNAYSVLLNGILDLDNTTDHSFGHVSGNGLLRIASTTSEYFVFPGGEYDEFMNTAGSLVEYFSDIPATLPNSIGTLYKPYQNIRFKGEGTKYFCSIDTRIKGDLSINAGYLSNEKANKDIYLSGNWTDATENGFIAGDGLITLEGPVNQKITVNRYETFANLSLSNPNGTTLTVDGTDTLEISNILHLNKGNIYSNPQHILYVSNSATDAVIGGNSQSFVDGPMRKTIDKSSSFNFPVGKVSRFGNIYVSYLSQKSVVEAEYFEANQNNPLSRVLPVDTVTAMESWRLNAPMGITGIIKVRWDSLTDIIPSVEKGLSKLRLVKWNGNAWEKLGDVVHGILSSGTIQSNITTSLSSDNYFSLGLEDLPKTRLITDNANLCGNGVDEVTAKIELTGEAPWTITCKVDGGSDQVLENQWINPAVVLINSEFDGINGPGTYQFRLTSVVDATGSKGNKDFQKTMEIMVKESPHPVITGKTVVTQNENMVNYSVTGNLDDEYVWNVTGGEITSGQGTNAITVAWGAGADGLVDIVETSKVTFCSMTDDLTVTISPNPIPEISGSKSVCQFSTEYYQVDPAPQHEFTWAVTGGLINGRISDTTAIGLNIIQVVWSNTGNGSVQVTEVVPGPVVRSGSDNISIFINDLPDNTLTVTDPSGVCKGSPALITVLNSAAGLDYTLRLNSNDSIITTVHSALQGDVNIYTVADKDNEYNILVNNEFGCGLELNDLAVVNTIWCGVVADFYSDRQTACENEVITFVNNSSGTTPNTTYEWEFGEGANPSTANGNGPHTVIFNSQGSKSIRLIVWDESSDTLLRNNYVSIVESPEPDLGEDLILCSGNNLTLETSENYESYLWSSTSVEASISINVPGTYWVEVTNGIGCSGTDTISITGAETPVVNLGNDTIICNGNGLQLDAGDFESYLWSTGETDRTKTVHASEGNISVTVTDENGCKGTDQIIIADCSGIDLLNIPNAFTPNNDRYHDEWEIDNINLFPNADIQVFDRWGRKVFQSDGSSAKSWDGTGTNGKMLPVETYYYVIDLKKDGYGVITGTVTLIR